MPLTDAATEDEPIDGEGEVLRLTPADATRVSWSIEDADDAVGVALQFRQKSGKWHTRKSYGEKKDHDDTVNVTAAEVRLYIHKPADKDGATADFYFAAGAS